MKKKKNKNIKILITSLLCGLTFTYINTSAMKNIINNEKKSKQQINKINNKISNKIKNLTDKKQKSKEIIEKFNKLNKKAINEIGEGDTNNIKENDFLYYGIEESNILSAKECYEEMEKILRLYSNYIDNINLNKFNEELKNLERKFEKIYKLKKEEKIKDELTSLKKKLKNIKSEEEIEEKLVENLQNLNKITNIYIDERKDIENAKIYCILMKIILKMYYRNISKNNINKLEENIKILEEKIKNHLDNILDIIELNIYDIDSYKEYYYEINDENSSKISDNDSYNAD